MQRQKADGQPAFVLHAYRSGNEPHCRSLHLGIRAHGSAGPGRATTPSGLRGLLMAFQPLNSPGQERAKC